MISHLGLIRTFPNELLKIFLLFISKAKSYGYSINHYKIREIMFIKFLRLTVLNYSLELNRALR